MLSPVLSINPKTLPHHYCSKKNSNGSKSNTTKQYHKPIIHLSALRSTPAVHDPTFSFIPFFYRPLTLLLPSVTSLQKFAESSIAIAVLSVWNKLPPTLRQLSDPSYELTKNALLAICSQLFYSVPSTNPIQRILS